MGAVHESISSQLAVSAEARRDCAGISHGIGSYASMAAMSVHVHTIALVNKRSQEIVRNVRNTVPFPTLTHKRELVS